MSSTTLGVPGAWREMQYAIVAALMHLGDDGPWYTTVVMSVIDELYGGGEPGASSTWDAVSIRAFNRAMDVLCERGVMTREDGYRLAAWDRP